jgi:steroid delta-isomerase-like uncharacterized protein
MSVEDDNKALVRRYYDLFNRNDLPTEEVIAPLASSIVFHRPGMPDVTGLTGMRQVVEMYRSWSTDYHSTIEDLVAEGDKVACRWSGRGTHQGDLMGVAATGKAITVTGIAIFRIANGKIREEWDYADVLGLMQQLGVGPLQSEVIEAERMQAKPNLDSEALGSDPFSSRVLLDRKSEQPDPAYPRSAVTSRGLRAGPPFIASVL